MIKLFNIPDYTINTTKFSNLLHDEIVEKFTENFCKYVGVKYGCAVNSASSAIFLLSFYRKLIFDVPCMIPRVVVNSIENGGGKINFLDDPSWVGSSYLLYNKEYRIIDSAQEVKPTILYGKDIAIYSFYPTKPVGSCDGGMIVSNDKGVIDFFKVITNNGMETNKESWNTQYKFSGWKMYMNSIQAYIANENLKKLDRKKEQLEKIRNIYNSVFKYKNESDHLYRINVTDNKEFLKYAKTKDIVCGIHYNKFSPSISECPISYEKSKHTVSIPFHENLTEWELEKVIECVQKSKMI